MQKYFTSIIKEMEFRPLNITTMFNMIYFRVRF